MISCDECEKRIVALLDNESTGEDEVLISAHLKECPRCRAFHEDVIRMGQDFATVTFPGLPAAVEQDVMREAVGDRPPSKAGRLEKGASPEPWRRRFRRLAWAGGLASSFVVALLSVLCFTMSKNVDALKQKLQIAERDVASFRAEKQIREVKERQEKEQKAITALYLRMGELEQRFDRVYSPRTAFLPMEGSNL